MTDDIKASTKPADIGKERAMTGAKQGIAGSKQDEDLRRNPGIGQSIGTSQGGDVELIEGKNSVEGDIDNNADAAGAVKLDKGRTNK